MNKVAQPASQESAAQWSDSAIAHLLDNANCPVCGIGSLNNAHCTHCGADLGGSVGLELWNVSQDAVTALRKRQEVLARVPRSLAGLGRQIATEDPQGSRESASSAVATDAVAAPDTVPRSSATVQSVLAMAGAGLFAVSAIVFTFFNPELSDHALRTTIIGVVTLLFLGGAWLLARRRLQFSAEAVGALGMVFVALDVYAFSELAPGGVSPWAFAAIGALAGGAAMVALAVVVGIRTWFWISLLGLASVPAMLGYAGGTALVAILGHVGTAFAGLALIELARAVTRRLRNSLQVEKVTLTVVQIVAVVVALAQLPLMLPSDRSATGTWLGICAILAAITVLGAVASRNPARGFWSFITGAAGIAAVTGLPFALDLGSHGNGTWYLALVPAAGAATLFAFGALMSTPQSIDRLWFNGGTIGVAVVSVVVTVAGALQIGAAQVLGSISGFDIVERNLGTGHVLAVGTGLAAAAAGFGAFAATAGRRDPARSPGAGGASAFALWLTALAGLVFACAPTLAPWGQTAIALALATAASAALVRVPRMRAARLRLRLPLIMGAHFAVLLAAIVSWAGPWLAVWAGIPIVAAIVMLALPLSATSRFLHVGAAYTYALIVVATALDQLGFGTIALLCLTTSVGLVGAMAATTLPQLRPANWYAILAVTSVPFMIGVVQVVFERSGWTALSTGIMFLLALTLLVSRRPGHGIILRALAAGLLVPSLAVVVVCLGAEVLAISASPVTLPVIAAIVALTLPSTGVISSALRHRGIGGKDAAVARIAIEASALLTGAIAVGLALIRVAAGLPTTFLVLVILAVGAAATAYWVKRRYAWWVAAACLTGALWCVWAMAGVGALEPYLLPPAVGAAIVGLTLTARGTRGVPLYASGLLLAVVPILVVLAISGSDDTWAAPWRGYGLLAASWLLLAFGHVLGQGASPLADRLSTLRASTLGVAMVAGAAGAVQGVRFGIGADTAGSDPMPLVVLCLLIGLAGGVPAALAARGILRGAAKSAESPERLSRIHQTSVRWYYAPAPVYVGVATWTAIERDWFTIWLMWSLMIAYLVAVVHVAARSRRGRTTLPPVWFLFALAFITAIVAWSPRDLRVEWFSLPLGLFLLTAGIVAMRGKTDAHGAEPQVRGTFNSWPNRWQGSWPLLAPGLGVMFLASILATFTDPQTWRAILVIGIALAAILVGASMKLAAPFLTGIIVLPVENFFVFTVQIGRGIESMPWWITLAVVGAVLLIIAVTYERRAGEDNSIAARLRDLS